MNKNDKQILLELAYALAFGLTYIYAYKNFIKKRKAPPLKEKKSPRIPQRKEKHEV